MEDTQQFDSIKIPIMHLVPEPKTCNGKDRFSHPGFIRKIPKWITPCDFDKTEKLIEVEYKDGNRVWHSIGTFFGIVINEAKNIYILYPDGETETMSIVAIETVKIKRTMFWKLIFERDLPFLNQ